MARMIQTTHWSIGGEAPLIQLATKAVHAHARAVCEEASLLLPQYCCPPTDPLVPKEYQTVDQEGSLLVPHQGNCSA